jgi:two-component system chemotaxis response regulator CheB
MRRLRVLIVDDSVVMRRMISDMVLSDPSLEVAGIAHHGRIALAKIEQVSPDLVTLDLDMPEMDGLETLARIRADHPDLPVIMVSALTERGTQKTLDALAMGATDYVTKPSNLLPNPASAAEVREELLGKIKSLGQAHLSRGSGRGAEARGRAGGAGARPRGDRGDRRFDRRPERADAAFAGNAGRLSRPAGGGAAHAAVVHAISG